MLGRLLGSPWALVLALGLGLGGGWQVRSWYQADKDLAVVKAEEKTREHLTNMAIDVAAATENALQGIRIENRTIYTTAQKEVVKEPIYLDCLLPANGVLRANQARQVGSATGQPDHPVPRTGTTGP